MEAPLSSSRTLFLEIANKKSFGENPREERVGWKIAKQFFLFVYSYAEIEEPEGNTDLRDGQVVEPRTLINFYLWCIFFNFLRIICGTVEKLEFYFSLWKLFLEIVCIKNYFSVVIVSKRTFPDIYTKYWRIWIILCTIDYQKYCAISKTTNLLRVQFSNNNIYQSV